MLKRSFKRLFWRISDVCELTGLDQQTLRGWEQDFKQLRPRRDSSGVRVYRERELRLVILLNELVVEDKQDIAESSALPQRQQEGTQGPLDAIDLDTSPKKPTNASLQPAPSKRKRLKRKAPTAEPEPTIESVEEPEESTGRTETEEEQPSEEQPAERSCTRRRRRSKRHPSRKSAVEEVEFR